MWTRQNLKANAKIAFKRNYWKCILVGLVLSIVTGSSGSSNIGSSFSSGFNAGLNSTSDTDSFTDDIFNDDIYYEDNVIDPEVENFINGLFSDSVVGLVAALGVTLLLIISLIILILGLAMQFFVFGPIEVGCANFFKVNAYEKAEPNKLTMAFSKKHYWNVAITMFLRNVYTVLWTMLFIIPGIIKAYEYRMIPFILSDCPEISRQDAFHFSKEMMQGNKWKAFVLDMSFIGWSLLTVITCGLAGLFYVRPYVAATEAELFIAIRQNYFKGQREAQNEDNADYSWEN